MKPSRWTRRRKLAHPLLDLRLRLLADRQAERDVVADRHVFEGRVVLEAEADVAILDGHLRHVLAGDDDLPRVGLLSPAITRRSVDLPEPDGPSRAVSEPSGTSIDTSLSAYEVTELLGCVFDDDSH